MGYFGMVFGLPLPDKKALQQCWRAFFFLRVHQILVDESDDVVNRFDGGVGGTVGVKELGLVEMVDGFAPELLAAVEIAEHIPALGIVRLALDEVAQRLMRFFEPVRPKKRFNVCEGLRFVVHLTPDPRNP